MSDDRKAFRRARPGALHAFVLQFDVGDVHEKDELLKAVIGQRLDDVVFDPLDNREVQDRNSSFSSGDPDLSGLDHRVPDDGLESLFDRGKCGVC